MYKTFWKDLIEPNRALQLNNSLFNRLLFPAFSPIYLLLVALFIGVISAYYEIPVLVNYILTSIVITIFVFKTGINNTNSYKLLLLFLALLSFIAGNFLLKAQLLKSNLLERSLLDKTFALEGYVLDSWEVAESVYKQVILIKLTEPDYYNSCYIKLYNKKPNLSIQPGSKIYCPAARSMLTVHPENNSLSTSIKRGRSSMLGVFFALKEVVCLHDLQGQHDSQQNIFTWMLNKITNKIMSKRRLLLNTITSQLWPYALSLYKTLFVGNSESYSLESQKIVNDFSLCGITHYLARSGLHVTILLIALYSLLRLIPCSFLLKKASILIALILYALLSWISVPFLRAFYCCALKELCSLAMLPFSLLHTLGLVCFLFVLYNPTYIFFLDFQLSFGATIILILMYEIEQKHKAINNSVKSIENKKI